jgi:hypothetical protein
MTDQTPKIPTYTCIKATCGYKTTIPCARCPECGETMSTNRNPNSTPTPKSEKAARTHIGEMTSAPAVPPHPHNVYARTFEPQRPQSGQEFLQWHQEDEMKRATGTATASYFSSSSNPPHQHNAYARSFEPQHRQEYLFGRLQRDIEEGEKKAARIAANDERHERARGFDEEDDDEFIPNIGKEGEGEKKDKGKEKERG